MLIRTVHFPELYRASPGADDTFFESRIHLLLRILFNCSIEIDEKGIIGEELVRIIEDWPPEHRDRGRALAIELARKKVFRRHHILGEELGAPGIGCNEALTMARNLLNVVAGIATNRPCCCAGECNVPLPPDKQILLNVPVYQDKFEEKRRLGQVVHIPAGMVADDFIDLYLRRIMSESRSIEVHDRTIGTIVFAAAKGAAKQGVIDDVSRFVEDCELKGIVPRVPIWGTIHNFERTIDWMATEISGAKIRNGRPCVFRIVTEIGLIRGQIPEKAVKAALYSLIGFERKLNQEWNSKGITFEMDVRLGLSTTEQMDHDRYLITETHAFRYDRGLDMVVFYKGSQRMKKTNLTFLGSRINGNDFGISLGEYVDEALKTNSSLKKVSEKDIQNIKRLGLPK